MFRAGARCNGPGLSWQDALALAAGAGFQSRLTIARRRGLFRLPEGRPVLLVVGNETTGMSAAWRELCDDVVRVPIGGAASSLNAAVAGTVLLYEAARQRGFPPH